MIFQRFRRIETGMKKGWLSHGCSPHAASLPVATRAAVRPSIRATLPLHERRIVQAHAIGARPSRRDARRRQRCAIGAA